MRLTIFLSRIARKPAINQGMAVLIDQALMSIATFVIGVLVARSSSPTEYGTYVLSWTLVFIVVGVHRAVVMIPFTVYLPRLNEPERSIYSGSNLLHTAIVSAIAISVATLGIATVYSRDLFTAGSTAYIYMLAILVAAPYLMREFIRGLLLARLRVFRSLIANGTISIITLGIVCTVYVQGVLSAEHAYLIIGGTAALASIYMFSRNRREFVFQKKVLWQHLIKNLQLGKWILANVVGFTIASQIFPWLLLWLQDETSVAGYGAALAVASVLTPFLRGANAYILPRMTHGYRGADQAYLSRLLRLSVLALAIPFGLWLLIASVFAEPIMELTYAGKYDGFGFVMAMLTARTAIEGISTPLTSALQTLEQPHVTTTALFLGAGTSLLLGVYLVTTAGVEGAAISAAVSSLVIALWKYVQIRQMLHKQLPAEHEEGR